MTECEELAAGMVEDYRVWLVERRLVDEIGIARMFVRTKVDEGPTITDNVAWALRAMLKPPAPPEPPAYPDLGTW